MVGKLPRYEYIFNDLDVSILPIDNPCIVTIKKDGVLFDFLIRLKPFSKKLLVFGSGAYDPRKMSPPFSKGIHESIILKNLLSRITKMHIINESEHATTGNELM